VAALLEASQEGVSSVSALSEYNENNRFLSATLSVFGNLFAAIVLY
jgi:hypothetical protein